MKLANKVVFVTGSSTGIGRETAIAFAKKETKVVITYNSSKKAGKEVLKECLKHTGALLLKLNVQDQRSIVKAVDAALKRFKRIDILVNNAGVAHWKRLEKQSMDDIDAQIQTNLLGVIKTTRVILPKLLKQKEGIIINIASTLGKKVMKEASVYCASKFGVRGFTQALAIDLPKKIRVYCLNPGLTSTRMTGFLGIAPALVAGIVVRTAEESLGKHSGDDIDVWDYVDCEHM